MLNCEKHILPKGRGAWGLIMAEANYQIQLFRRLKSKEWSVEIFFSPVSGQRWVSQTNTISFEKSIFRYSEAVDLLAIQYYLETQLGVVDCNNQFSRYAIN